MFFLRIDMSEDEEEYWQTIQDDSKKNTAYGTLENAVSLMKYMHLPKTRMKSIILWEWMYF